MRPSHALAALLLVLVPAQARAEAALPTYTAPKLYRSDGGIVRASPEPDAPALGRLAAGAAIEAVLSRGTWAMVVAGERNGWVALDGLSPLPDPGPLPGGLVCFGTEPFWGLHPDGGGAVMSSPFEDDVRFTAGPREGGEGVRGLLALWLTGPGGGSAVLLIQNRICSDGMSDALHGRWAALIREGRPVRTGCCGVGLPELLPAD